MQDAGGVSLVCRVGPLLCAVPIAHVGETMRPLPIQPLAGVAPFVHGVAIVRDRPTPVIDAARLLCDAASPPGRFVTITTGAHVFALAVDAVLGVVPLTFEVADALPSPLRTPRLAAVSAAAMLDGDLLLLLERSRIVPPEVWARLEPGDRPG